MTMTHAAPRPATACSVEWDDAALSVAGSAPTARFWVCLEQNGPWGNKAITQSHLDPAVGGALEQACAAHGGRLLLIRRPGLHADPATRHGAHTVLVAGGLERDPWLLTATIDDPAVLLDLPWDALLAPDPRGALEVVPQLRVSDEPVLLVCTNGKRDVCCAVRGRPVALELAQTHPGQVWECSHTGGHRFAPTGVALPSGHVYGRLTATLAAQALAAEGSGEVPAELATPGHDRGRSCFPPAVQAAEAYVRRLIVEPSTAALAAAGTEQPDGTWRCDVTHRDGRTWTLTVTGEEGAPLKSSCAKDAVPAFWWTVDPASPAVAP